MEEYLMVAVKDKVAGKFMQPNFTENQETAKRIFAHQLKNIDLWRENAEQFELYDLGLFCVDTGNIIGNQENNNDDYPIIHPELICKGTDLIET